MIERLEGASWIARTVPPGQRIIRQVTASRVDRVVPGHSLGQTFRAEGPITAVNVNLVSPGEAAEAHTADVCFSVRLEDAAGRVVAERRFEGPQLVWDYFGPFLDVTPMAPPGDYTVVLHSERGAIGWSTAELVATKQDDGVSPLPVAGTALLDGVPVDGVRMIGIETLPAPNPVFRRVIALDAAPQAALLSATILGTGVVRINGVRVGEEMLEPAVTDYDKTVLFRSWDVAHLLRAGENELLFEAGRERYAARGGDTWGWHLAPWHREPTAIARLDLVDANRRSTTIVTDESWETAPGAVEADRLFRGEDWVIRTGTPDWEPVTVVEPPAGTLRLAELPPVLGLPPVPALAVEELDAHRVVLDFGEVMVGRIRARVSGGPGGKITVLSGEQRGDDGVVLCDNVLVAGQAQMDSVRLETDVTDLVWEPQFGYRGFRWVQIETSGDVTVEEVRAVPLYAEVERVGELKAAHPVLEWIDAATARTFRNNLHGIPTDTPIYEKNGWTADAHLATEALLHHFDLKAAFGKWIDDHRDAQGRDGAIPWIVPTPGWGRSSDPTWSSSAVLIPWYLYREYGDRGILERSASMISRFADDVLAKLDGDDIWRRRTWGDWLSPGHLVGPEGMAPIGTAMTVTMLRHAAAILAELGHGTAAAYVDAADRVGRAYHAMWFDPGTGRYMVDGVGHRQVLDILPLAFDIVPGEHVASVRRRLIEDLESRTHGHLDCGAVGVRHLLPVLSAAGRDDLAISVLTARTRPGWGAWFAAGESTLLESWDVDARSRNHYFLGSVAAWIQQRVGGLRLTEPGWRRFEIAPVDDPRVDRASIRHRTPLGEAQVAWQRGPGGWRFAVTVPPGASAAVRVPGAHADLGPGVHIVHLPGSPLLA